ncbi:MAG: hypothetical protein RSA91_05300 [Bacilli bacterium]
MKKFKTYLEELGLSFKKEIISICLIFGIELLAIIGIIVFYRTFIVFFGSGFVLLGTALFIYKTYKDKEKQLLSMHFHEFKIVFSYLQIYLSNSIGVYKSLDEIRKYAPIWIENKISILLEETNSDGSVKPFINFAKNFSIANIDQIMIIIYNIQQTNFNEKYLLSFNDIFSKISEDDYKNNKEKQSEKTNNLNFLPLFGSFMFVLTIIVGVFSILGEFINGI